ncbi:MAG: hypothetical protein JWO29_418, partial [Arthrobacter sp.]|nr:hypothetical protein [Arthrobacter sp.]
MNYADKTQVTATQTHDELDNNPSQRPSSDPNKAFMASNRPTSHHPLPERDALARH